jgi:hypothetical protein
LIRRLLVWVGGADPNILRLVPAEAIRHARVGLLTLLSFALTLASVTTLLAQPEVPGVMVVVGALFGLFTVMVERMLTAVGPPHESLKQRVATAAPKALVAVALGAIVAAPIVLAVYRVEINGELQIRRELAASAQQQELDNFAANDQIRALDERVRQLRATISDPSSDPAVERAASALEAANRAYDRAEAEVQCEATGTCGSNRVGRGPYYRELVARAEAARAARDRAKAEYDSAVAAAGAKAQQELDTLLKRREELFTAQRAKTDRAVAAALSAGPDGLQQRWQALTALARRGDAVGGGVLLLMVLLTFMSAAPVLVRLAQALGQPSTYDRIRRERQLVDAEVRELAAAYRASLVADVPVMFRGRITLIPPDTETATGGRIWTAGPERELHFAVVVSTGLDNYENAPTQSGSGAALSERMAVESGRDSDSVDLDLDIDVPFVRVLPASHRTTLGTDHDEQRLDVVMHTPREGEYDGRLSVYCAGRLVQSVPWLIKVSDDTPTGEAGESDPVRSSAGADDSHA